MSSLAPHDQDRTVAAADVSRPALLNYLKHAGQKTRPRTRARIERALRDLGFLDAIAPAQEQP
jgi:hypothetical protein